MTGAYSGSNDAGLPNTVDAGFLTALDALPLFPKAWNGANEDDVHDVAIGPLDQLVAVGALTEGGEIGTPPLTAPSSRAGFAVRYDASGTEIWRTLLSENDGSDAEATNVAMIGDTALVVGSFDNTQRIFGTATLDAVGQRDMFVAVLDVGGSLTAAQSYGAVTSTVEPETAAALGSDLVLGGRLMGAMQTPAGEVACPTTEECGFLIRLPQPSP